MGAGGGGRNHQRDFSHQPASDGGKKKILQAPAGPWGPGRVDSRVIPAGSSARPRRLTRLPVSAIKKSHVCLPPLATTRPLVSTACQTRTRARGGGGGEQTNRQTKIEKKATFLHYDFSGRIKKRLADWSPPALPGAHVVQSPRRPSPHYNTPFSRWWGQSRGT